MVAEPAALQEKWSTEAALGRCRHGTRKLDERRRILVEHVLQRVSDQGLAGRAFERAAEAATDEAERVMYAALRAGLNFKLTMGNILTLTPALTLKGEGVRIDVSGLPPGVYFVRVGDEVRTFLKI